MKKFEIEMNEKNVRRNLREDLKKMHFDTRCIRAVETQVELDYDVQTTLDEIGLDSNYYC